MWTVKYFTNRLNTQPVTQQYQIQNLDCYQKPANRPVTCIGDEQGDGMREATVTED